MLLVVSQSLNERNPDTRTETLLELSEEALAITAWTVERRFDKFCDCWLLRYSSWGDMSILKATQSIITMKLRRVLQRWKPLSQREWGLPASYSTLSWSQAEKKINAILTDGNQPISIPKIRRWWFKDTRWRFVNWREEEKGIHAYCITLDQKRISMWPDVAMLLLWPCQLPEQLPQEHEYNK